jgi:hypothetical protein
VHDSPAINQIFYELGITPVIKQLGFPKAWLFFITFYSMVFSHEFTGNLVPGCLLLVFFMG